MRPTLSILLIALACALVPARAGALPARAVRFVFEGAVSEPGGKPLRGVEVRAEGSAARPTVTDGQGRFALQVELPDLRACAAAPARIVVRARRRGWNLTLPEGASGLVIELRVAGGPEGDRVEVRSSDAAAARAVAAALRAPGDAMVGLSLRFVRVLGREDLSPPALGALEVVAFDPDARPLPASAPAPPLAADSLRLTEPALTTGAARHDAASPGARASAATPVPGAPVSAVTPAPKVVPTPPPPAAAFDQPVTPVRERPPEMRLFPSAPDETTPAAGRAARDSTPASAVAPWRETSAPPAAAPRRAGPAPRLSAPGRDTTPRPASAARAGAKAHGRPQPAAPLPPVIQVSVRDDSTPAATAGPAPGGGALRVAHGVVVPAAGDSSAPRGCSCVVNGTVEVRSERPLGSSLRVIVRVVDAPARADTVTLFMGSPRPFDLGRLPCGTHRLEVRPLGPRRFAVVAPPTPDVPCAAEARPVRVVLEPR